MKINFRTTHMLWLLGVTCCQAQANDIVTVIKSAQERSSLVKSALANVEIRKANLSVARSSSSAYLELGPGIGFTNGNSILSQDFDLFGKRKSATLLANTQLKLAELAVVKARSEVTVAVLNSLANYLAATEESASVRESLEAAKALQVAAIKRHEIGEVPKVHVTRAELDVLRASQAATLVQGKLNSTLASLTSITGGSVKFEQLRWPTSSKSAQDSMSFDLLAAKQAVAITEAQTTVVQSDFAPTFSAAIASDAWSLDRQPFQSDRFGLQFTLRVPLGDKGKKRGAVLASQHETSVAKANVIEAKRIADLRLIEAKSAFDTAHSLAASYEGEILPKGETMLRSMRDGYAAGLVTLVEVLEAQQILFKLRQERAQSLLSLRLAELEFWQAQLSLPGVEVP